MIIPMTPDDPMNSIIGMIVQVFFGLVLGRTLVKALEIPPLKMLAYLVLTILVGLIVGEYLFGYNYDAKCPIVYQLLIVLGTTGLLEYLIYKHKEVASEKT
jgi:hypothetical protein